LTIDYLVHWFEAYYGEYKPVVKAEVLEWLKDKSQVFIIGLRIAVRDTYSNQYRIPPDVAVLNKYRCQDTYDRGYKLIEASEQKRISELAKEKE